MITVITETMLKPGLEAQWDHAFHARIANASEQPGWVAVNLLTATDDPCKRVVIGTWNSREDWDRWHETDAFKLTRPLLAEATQDEGQPQWFNIDMAMIHAAPM